jgi:hypothetical protein
MRATQMKLSRALTNILAPPWLCGSVCRNFFTQSHGDTERKLFSLQNYGHVTWVARIRGP